MDEIRQLVGADAEKHSTPNHATTTQTGRKQDGHPDDGKLSRPCIAVSLSTQDTREMTVADYDEVQQLRYDQPLWARKVNPVERLSEVPAQPYDVHIIDLDAYNAQMRILIGLD